MVTLDASELGILSRVIPQGEPSFSPQFADEILKWRFSESDHSRMSELAAKARAGTMTEKEKTEAENFERINCLLGLLQSKARRALHRQ